MNAPGTHVQYVAEVSHLGISGTQLTGFFFNFPLQPITLVTLYQGLCDAENLFASHRVHFFLLKLILCSALSAHGSGGSLLE